MFDILSNAIAKGENVELRGLGTFSVKQVKEKKSYRQSFTRK
jgi:nucleoid DNA-binding protein